MDEKTANIQALQSQAAQLQQALANAQRQGISNLAKAFVAAWGEIPAVVEKDAQNPHFGSDYATLEAVQKIVKPVLRKHELAFLQTPGAIDANGNITVTGVLLHSSGERLELTMQMPIGKASAQAAGSATTYARRYQLMAVFGIAPTDDDGEAASAPAPAKAKAKKAEKTEEPTYAEGKEELLAAIEAFSGSADDLSKQFKAQVESLADAEVNKAYVAKRRALKG